jgi:hypothetical protein
LLHFKVQDIRLDRSRAGETKMQFGIGTITSLGTIDIITPIRKIIFYIIPADILFLLLLQDLDILGAMFNNFQNIFIQKGKRILIIRTYSYL